MIFLLYQSSFKRLKNLFWVYVDSAQWQKAVPKKVRVIRTLQVMPAFSPSGKTQKRKNEMNAVC